MMPFFSEREKKCISLRDCSITRSLFQLVAKCIDGFVDQGSTHSHFCVALLLWIHPRLHDAADADDDIKP